MPSAAAPSLTDEQFMELFALLGDSDSTELKMMVPDSQQRSAALALGLDPLDVQVRMVYFFDTPDLKLDKAGLVVRARRVQGKGDDTVVKLRPCVPSDLPVEVRESGSFNVEVDAMPGGFVCSGSMKGVPRKATVWDTAAGGAPLRKLFSKEQRAFYAAHAPEGIEFDHLSLLGPIFVLKLKGTPRGFNRKLVGEMWLYPDGTRLVELSTKCLPSEAFQVAAEVRAFLGEHGIKPAAGGTTKTRKALDFFSAPLRKKPQARA